MNESIDQSTTVVDPLDAVREIAANLADTTRNIEHLIETRAAVMANPAIQREREASAALVAEARAEAVRAHEAAAEAIRQCRVQERRADLAEADARQLRAAGWKPKAYPLRPLTPEQEESAAHGHARADWPQMVAVCDPTVLVSVDEYGATVTVACAKTDEALAVRTSGILGPSATKWSELCDQVAGHRCDAEREVAA